MAYRLVICAKLPTKESDDEGNTIYNEELKYLELDTCSERRIQATSTIASQPIQSGDIMSDHMYRNPDKYSVSGIFSLFGKNWDDTSYSIANVSTSTNRLTNIEDVFEYIKDNGVLCDLITFDYSDNEERSDNQRFKIRNNMALTSISWTEKQNSISYGFEFQEVIAVDMIEYDVDVYDPFLPNLNYPKEQSLSQVLFDTKEIYQTILEYLVSKGYFQNEFLVNLRDNLEMFAVASVAALGVVATVLVGVAVAAGIVAATSALIAAGVSITLGAALIFPVGTVIAVGVAVVAGIIGIFKWNENKEKKKKAERKAAKMFKLANGSCEEGMQKLTNLLEDIQVDISNMTFNLSLYNMEVEVDEQGYEKHDPITSLLTIGGEYYYLKFKWDEEAYMWTCDVEDFDEKPIQTKHDFPIQARMTDFDENNTMWFRSTDKQYQVYVLNPSLALDENSSAEKQKNVKSRLNGVTIWVSKGKISDNVNSIQNAIINALYNREYV